MTVSASASIAHRQLALQPAYATREPTLDLEQRLAKAALRRVEAKELVFAEGDPTTHIYKIETGAVCLYKVLSDGRRQVLGFAYPGDLIGLGAQGEHFMNAQAMKPTRLRSLPISILKQIASQDPRLGYKLYQVLAEELAATRDLMLTTGQRSAVERVAAFLVALSRRNERNGLAPETIDLPMTRSDIADFLGLTIETVSRTLTKLRMSGIVDLPQSAHVHLLETERLQHLADGEDHL